MRRAYYEAELGTFLGSDELAILGALTKEHTHDLNDLLRNSWIEQIRILKRELKDFSEGYLFLEFAIPRMGRRVDCVIVWRDRIYVIEFKVGDRRHRAEASYQVLDYALDLSYFHETSHSVPLIPVLVSTRANNEPIDFRKIHDQVYEVIRIGSSGISLLLLEAPISGENIDPEIWASGRYKPTPTIIEAAQALYEGHNVRDIAQHSAEAKNLAETTECINHIIDASKESGRKSICFVTGVPGAGKTLVGLNLSIYRRNSNENEHAVFLSGNVPLVRVLQEALARDEVARLKERKLARNKKASLTKTEKFINNIHHFRDECLKSDTNAPYERVVVFDEAQRAWTVEKTADFMKRKKGRPDFSMSEPEFLISAMDRHEGSCTIVCLVGGGQEINTGEAGLVEWVNALRKSFSHWSVYYSGVVVNDENYLRGTSEVNWLRKSGTSKHELHLAVSRRSFRSECVSDFVKAVLDLEVDRASELFINNISDSFPIVITRDLVLAKEWLRVKAKGSHRYGLVASSEAMRLRPYGVNVDVRIDPANWFLNPKNDIRSSYFMEEVASQFDIQGLELDWVGLCWDADFSIDEFNNWTFKSFSGTKWNTTKVPINKEYLKNAYRVLLTRARQGMVIFIPMGDTEDNTRLPQFYSGTFEYLKSLGIPELTN